MRGILARHRWGQGVDRPLVICDKEAFREYIAEVGVCVCVLQARCGVSVQENSISTNALLVEWPGWQMGVEGWLLPRLFSFFLSFPPNCLCASARCSSYSALAYSIPAPVRATWFRTSGGRFQCCLDESSALYRTTFRGLDLTMKGNRAHGGTAITLFFQQVGRAWTVGQ